MTAAAQLLSDNKLRRQQWAYHSHPTQMGSVSDGLDGTGAGLTEQSGRHTIAGNTVQHERNSIRMWVASMGVS
jgi:hypothetical protein